MLRNYSMTTFQAHVIDFEIEASLILLHVRALLYCHRASHVISICTLPPQTNALIHTIGPLQSQRGHNAAGLFSVKKSLKQN